MDAELVALGIEHHGPHAFGFIEAGDLRCAERSESFDLDVDLSASFLRRKLRGFLVWSGVVVQLLPGFWGV